MSNGDSVRVQRIRIQGDSVWLNDSLVVDSTWSADFDSSLVYSLRFDESSFDVPMIDTAEINATVRSLEFEMEDIEEGFRRFSRDSTGTVIGLSRYVLDSSNAATTSLDSLMDLGLSPDSLAARIERGLRSRDSLSVLLPRLERGLRPEVYRFEMETKDRLGILRDRASTAEEMRQEAERLRREAERMEQRARELDKEQGDEGEK